MSSSQQILFKRELQPIPGVKISNAVQFHGTGNLSTGCDGDALYLDKSTKNWRRWVYFKCKKRIPDLCTNVYGNKLFIESIERAAIATEEGRKSVAEDLFRKAMENAEEQFANPRSDSAEALDRLGEVCLRRHETSKAITCFEYSLHMRRLIYGKEANHERILQSLVYLGCAWSKYENMHRAIIVFERALLVAKALAENHVTNNQKVQVAEILHNLGTCWEALREHHTALKCFEEAHAIRHKVATPEVCVGAHVTPHFLGNSSFY